MKKVMVLLVGIFIYGAALTQSETLFSNNPISGFGGPIFSVSTLNDEVVYFGGGGGGLIIGDFFIGGFGEGGTISNTFVQDDVYDIELGYGGLWMGYSIANRKAIHPFIGLKWAGGESTVTPVSDNRALQSDKIQVLQPELGLEFNFTLWMRLVAHVGYRNVIGVDSRHLVTNEELSGISGGITLRFGFFR